jgi:prevent-host-death family protein
VKRVKIADLKNNLSRYLNHVRDGGELMVLDRETPVARIVPFAPREVAVTGKAVDDDEYWTEARLANLERRGTISRGNPRGVGAWLNHVRPVKLPEGTPSAVDALLQMRRESRR